MLLEDCRTLALFSIEQRMRYIPEERYPDVAARNVQRSVLGLERALTSL
jgi:hypothetical protein